MGIKFSREGGDDKMLGWWWWWWPWRRQARRVASGVFVTPPSTIFFFFFFIPYNTRARARMCVMCVCVEHRPVFMLLRLLVDRRRVVVV